MATIHELEDFRFRPSAAYKAATRLREWGPVRDNWVRMRRIIGD